VCSGQSSHRSLSFGAETETVTDPVQLPNNVLDLVLKDKEEFPLGAPANLGCKDREHFADGPRPQMRQKKASRGDGTIWCAVVALRMTV
jgi:hypothetical protein